MIAWLKNVHNFQMARVEPQGVTYHLLYFLQFGVANESVAYIKKRVYIDLTNAVEVIGQYFIFVKKNKKRKTCKTPLSERRCKFFYSLYLSSFCKLRL